MPRTSLQMQAIAPKILAADIGGTSSRFAYFTVSDSGLEIAESVWLETKEASSFYQLLEQLEAEPKFSLRLGDIDILSLAVAGPVEGGVYSKPPLIDWDIDLSHVDKHFHVKSFSLINDFVAQAYACISPIAKTRQNIIAKPIKPQTTVAVIGAGTGLGKAALVPDEGSSYHALPSEGGHANFAAESQKEFEFHEFVKEKLKIEYATWNDIVSGNGLSLIHEFLTKEEISPEEVADTFEQKNKSFEWAARFYARVSRNFALETLALGGLFISGGVAAKNPILVDNEIFRETFTQSPKHHALLNKIPVFLMTNQESGLWGAAYYGLQKLRNASQNIQ